MNKDMDYIQIDSLLQDAQQIIEAAQRFAYKAVDIAMVKRNWLLGKRISEEELQGNDRAKYGAEIIKKLSAELTRIYGKGFTKTNLYSYTEFYKAFSEIFHAVSGKFSENIFHAVSGKSELTNLDALRLNSFPLLTWTHYRTLLQVEDANARNWYMNEAAEQTWSTRTLQRNISSQYYFRLLQSYNNEQLFASKYKTYMPSEEDLRAEIETQKRLFYLQQSTKGGNDE